MEPDWIRDVGDVRRRRIAARVGQYAADGPCPLWRRPLHFPASNLYLKEIYASILTAYAAGKPVALSVSGSVCTSSNPTALVVDLQ